MINICFFLGTFRIGGAENLIFQIINRLDREKYRIYVCVFSKNGELLQNYINLGVEIQEFPQKRKIFHSGIKFLKFLKQKEIDCIHINHTGTFLFAVTLSRLIRLKNIIIHWHNVYFFKKKSIRNFRINLFSWAIIKYSGKLANSIIAISQKVKDHNCKIFNINKSKVQVVYNSIDFSLIPLKHNMHLDDNKITIGSIGNVSEQKGYDTLILAFNIVLEKYPECKLEIVGRFNSNEDYCLKILNLTKENGLINSVFFLGALPNLDVYKRLFSWNIFVLASKWEGFGIVLIEAMASGTPVIASNVDAIPEIIDNERTGLLFQVNNPMDLSEKIIKLIKDKKLSNDLIVNAKKEVFEKFSIERMIKQLDCLYTL